ncbi:MAG: YgiQ family radical SAM protein [Desulfamplus sp.]|nr:YgiQ family radical SAM protein [Desulfamplus sp.]
MFLPTTTKELSILGWQSLDVILVTGDAYIDSPSTGVAVIGKTLVKNGFKVGIIAQPDIDSDKDITRLGEPSLFWGISSGAVDSMVSNYTALKKRRKSDDYTPGGINNRRPDRAVIAYANLVKRYFKNTSPIVLGGIEASLRRICHYDFWSDSVRRSILFDAKADYLIYGMGESAVIQLANVLKGAFNTPKDNEAEKKISQIHKIRGLCYISKVPQLPDNLLSNDNCPSGEIISKHDFPSDIYHSKPPFKYIPLPSYEIVKQDKDKFAESFHTFYKNNDPLTAHGLVQQQDSRYLVQNPPAFYPDTQGMDEISALEFERDVHPYYKQSGKVAALDTIQFSISTHRGCYGECNFCSIALHEGRTVRWRSEESIINEINKLTQHPDFKGIISDVGGPTANMYGFECEKKLKHGACQDKRCMFPNICKNLKPDHSNQIELLKKIRQIKGVRKVFVASGIRYDLIFADKKHGNKYLESIVKDHVSGQLKVAPEHTQPHLLELMGKSDKPALLDNSNVMADTMRNKNKIRDSHTNSHPFVNSCLLEFKKRFDELSQTFDKRQFLTYYLMADHPGCTLDDMEQLKKFAREQLHITPEQIQIFTPTPSSYSTLMYYTQKCPFTGEQLFVEKNIKAKEKQKNVITQKHISESENRAIVRGETKRQGDHSLIIKRNSTKQKIKK